MIEVGDSSIARRCTASALLTAFIVVPLGTALLEEVAFRGVAVGLVSRRRGAAWASITSSVLFGL